MTPFISTRNTHAKSVDFTQAILSPTASNRGLYTLPALAHIDFSVFLDSSYAALCEHVFQILGIEVESAILHKALASYERFDTPENPAPIAKFDNAFFLELYHGPTRAFKDMALCPFGEIFSALALRQDRRYLILTATSGDTGPATLHALAHKPNVKVICLYPEGGTSEVQGLQMQTANAENLKVLGIKGDFDCAQSLLKSLLASQSFQDSIAEKGYALSAANSVNFGRIAFQIIYYIWGYLSLVRQKVLKYGEEIYVSVPSGNFGNALGAFFAKSMGLPIEKILIASNANNILTELITSGVYDISHKSLHKSISPAMDILKSSNVERVLFALYGDERTKELLESLESTQRYALTPSELALLQDHFQAWWGDDEQTKSLIKSAYQKGYLLDPHTALAYGAYKQLGDGRKALICSTAEWSKFAPSVVEAIFGECLDDRSAIAKMLESSQAKGGVKVSIGADIQGLFNKPRIHTQVLEPGEVESAILQWL